MRSSTLLASLFISFVLIGCAAQPQQPIQFNSSIIEKSGGKIGVVTTSVPSPDLYLPGADCLLCYAVASAAHSSLSDYVQSFSNQEVGEIRDELARLLEYQDRDVLLIKQDIDVEKLPKLKSNSANAPKRDFSDFAAKHGVQRLIVIEVNSLGVTRPYSSYVPTGDAQATVFGAAYLLDVNKNTLLWYKPIKITQPSEGDWKEPPNYPGLTNACYQMLENFKDQVLAPFDA